jgi:hypothetical protein
MYKFLLAIKDWLPSIAVIVWGIWLLFQWRFGEKLRQRKEGPSLDGQLSATMIRYEDGSLLVTVKALWNNHSPLSVYLDLDECKIHIFRIDSSKVTENGVVEFEGLGDRVCTHQFLRVKYKKYYRLEPGTESPLVNHFVLEPGIYGIRMQVLGSTRPFEENGKIEKKGEKWFRELVLDLRAQTSKTDPVLSENSIVVRQNSGCV